MNKQAIIDTIKSNNEIIEEIDRNLITTPKVYTDNNGGMWMFEFSWHAVAEVHHEFKTIEDFIKARQKRWRNWRQKLVKENEIWHTELNKHFA